LVSQSANRKAAKFARKKGMVYDTDLH
jgi:hypothetical protein